MTFYYRTSSTACPFLTTQLPHLATQHAFLRPPPAPLLGRSCLEPQDLRRRRRLRRHNLVTPSPLPMPERHTTELATNSQQQPEGQQRRLRDCQQGRVPHHMSERRKARRDRRSYRKFFFLLLLVEIWKTRNFQIQTP